VYLRYGPQSLLISKSLPRFGTLGPPLAGMFNPAIWRFLLVDATGALLWTGAHVGTGWLSRRQLEDVVAALSRFGAAIGSALVAGVLAYLIFKCVRLWRNHRANRAHRMTPAELKQRMEAGDPLVVVDLRADAERQEGCIPGAVAVAFRDLDSLLPIVGVREVVFYCSCPNELASIRAALRLERQASPAFMPWNAALRMACARFPVDASMSRMAPA